jgi:hypothetical protein
MITHNNWLDTSTLFTRLEGSPYEITTDMKDIINSALIRSLSYQHREQELIDELNVNIEIKTYRWYREFPIRFQFFWETISKRKLTISIQRKWKSISNEAKKLSKSEVPDDFKVWCEKKLRRVGPDDWLDTDRFFNTLGNSKFDTIDGMIDDMIGDMEDEIEYALISSMDYQKIETQKTKEKEDQKKCLEMNVSGTYFIHNSGLGEFTVVIYNDIVRVYRPIDFKVLEKKSESGAEFENIYETFPILTFEPQKNSIFIGKSPIMEMTVYSGCYGSKYDGRSILIHMGDNIYVHIGEEIYSFESLGQIVDFVSPVGNNVQIYPYAKDKNGNVYLLLENVVIKKTPQTEKEMKQYENPYVYYYDHNKIIDDEDHRGGPRKPKVKNFQNIKKFLIGSEPHILTYNVNPEEHYEMMRSWKNQMYKMYIIDTSGKKTLLTTEMYIQLNESFGTQQSFEGIKNKIIHYK